MFSFIKNFTNYSPKSFKGKTTKEILAMKSANVPDDFFTDEYTQAHLKEFDDADLSVEQENAIDLLSDLKNKPEIIRKCYDKRKKRAQAQQAQAQQAPTQQAPTQQAEAQTESDDDEQVVPQASAEQAPAEQAPAEQASAEPAPAQAQAQANQAQGNATPQNERPLVGGGRYTKKGTRSKSGKKSKRSKRKRSKRKRSKSGKKSKKNKHVHFSI